MQYAYYQFEYFMEGKNLNSVESKKDIGVIIDKKLKQSQHFSVAVRNNAAS